MNVITVKCNLCGADDYTVMYDSNLKGDPPTVEDYTSTINRYGFFDRIVSCNKCGLVYMNPRDTGIKDLYREVVDEQYLDSKDERAATFRKHLRALGRYAKKGGELLDIGCYTGIFLEEAAKEGYQVTGVEASRWAAECARKISEAKIIEGSWDEVDIGGGSFDVVTMWDVIEHLEDPSACIKKAHEWLREDGILAISTHDIHSFFAKIMGKRYPWLMRFHLYHFDPATLTEMLSKNGFSRIGLEYYIKGFSLKYVLSRFGLNVTGRLFKKISLSFNTGDLFMIVARKI
ncbi:MAG TPA: class I SAM-dependent methyltransferase [Candidatus Omnitrophota bacterium]|nr:class I SAM-dependent methyltransferase [Candidatus Omnitrophota bacterium]